MKIFISYLLFFFPLMVLGQSKWGFEANYSFSFPSKNQRGQYTGLQVQDGHFVGFGALYYVGKNSLIKASLAKGLVRIKYNEPFGNYFWNGKIDHMTVTNYDLGYELQGRLINLGAGLGLYRNQDALVSTGADGSNTPYVLKERDDFLMDYVISIGKYVKLKKAEIGVEAQVRSPIEFSVADTYLIITPKIRVKL
jgi:hypothetical protein